MAWHDGSETEKDPTIEVVRVAAETGSGEITIVVLGATGDMAKRLLFPALYSLALAERLPDVRIVGYGLDDLGDEKFCELVREGIDAQHLEVDGAWEDFAAHMTYRQGELHADQLAPIGELIAKDAVFYLALPPGLFATAATALAEAGLASEENGSRRLVVEKPFGTDLESALRLNAELHENWTEDQIFRIDHFLGKETVQNIMVFRFANRFFEPAFNSAHIEQVQITVAESLGLEGRYRYYDEIGALRDMVQNHLLQLFTIVAIEPPAIWDADVLHDHKVEVLKAVRPLSPQDCERDAVRAQYVEGRINGEDVPGYREEGGVEEGSTTETFAAVKLQVDNWRWKGVPFYLRTGKRLASKHSEIAIQFRRPPTRLFESSAANPVRSNWLVFTIQPEDAIDLGIRARAPGLGLTSRQLTLHAEYAQEDEAVTSAYEQLLLDVLEGTRTPFLRFDEVEWSWRVIEPLLKAWESGEPEIYRAGTDGPFSQSKILERGHEWRGIGG